MEILTWVFLKIDHLSHWAKSNFVTMADVNRSFISTGREIHVNDYQPIMVSFLLTLVVIVKILRLLQHQRKDARR